jgi:hypothetical protein
LSKVEGKPEDFDVVFPHANETGRDKGIHDPVELECANTIVIYLARLISYRDDLRAVLKVEAGQESKHLWGRIRLSKHEVPLLIKRPPIANTLRREAAFLECLENLAMTVIHLEPIQIDVFPRVSAREMAPSVWGARSRQHPQIAS